MSLSPKPSRCSLAHPFWLAGKIFLGFLLGLACSLTTFVAPIALLVFSCFVLPILVSAGPGNKYLVGVGAALASNAGYWLGLRLLVSVVPDALQIAELFAFASLGPMLLALGIAWLMGRR